jgi:hypothetical protein
MRARIVRHRATNKPVHLLSSSDACASIGKDVQSLSSMNNLRAVPPIECAAVANCRQRETMQRTFE